MTAHDQRPPTEDEIPDEKNVIIIALMSVSAVLVVYVVMAEMVVEPLQSGEPNLLHVIVGSGFSLVMLGFAGLYLHRILRERKPSVLADEVSPRTSKIFSLLLVLIGVGLALYDLHQWMHGEGAVHLIFGVVWLAAAAGYLVYEKMRSGS